MLKLRILVCALGALITCSVHAAPLTIDDFQTAQPGACIGGFPCNNPSSSSNEGIAGSMLGGFRNIEVTRSGGSSFGIVTVASNTFIYGMVLDPGYGRIIWDGDLNSSLNYALASIDLTGGGTRDSFRIRAQSDLGGTIILTVFSSSTAFSSLSIALPTTGSAYTDYIRNFGVLTPGAPTLVLTDLGLANTTTAADLNNITAITLFIDGTTVPQLDAQIQLLEVTAEIPEPGTYALISAGLLSLFALRRKRA